MTAATQLTELLELRTQPVAIAFRESAPREIPRIENAAPSGCTYWKYAAEGRTFFTEAADHYNCPVGAHTHGVDLPDQKREELQGLVGLMIEIEYLRPDEVAQIPRRQQPLRVVVYAPLAKATFPPDVIMVLGSPKQMMLLAEAAQAAGVACETSMVGRPTCAAIPEVLETGQTATNLGCIGNRVYTGIEDGELYFALAGSQLENIVEKLKKIVNANRQLEQFHRDRMLSLAGSTG
jgi:uncharacterized protein (DUF169 family)